MLWWELRVGNVTLRDLCSSWGDDAKKGGGAAAAAAAAAPAAKTLMSGSASGVDGREWVSGGDPSGAAERCATFFFTNCLFWLSFFEALFFFRRISIKMNFLCVC